MSLLLTTGSVPRAQRREYWTDMICDAYVHLECDYPEGSAFASGAGAAGSQGDDGGFEGSILCDEFASLRLSVVSSHPQFVQRTPRQIARGTQDYFLVSIQARGRGIVRQDGRTAVLQPGDFALYDSTRPYELVFEDRFEQMVLMLPGEQLRSQLRDTEQLTATAVSGRQGAGHLMITMLHTLRADIDSLQPASAAAVADGVLNILAAGLRTLPAARRQGISDLTTYHLLRIKRFVREHLRDPQLSVPMIAAGLNLSAGHVHRLFQNEPLPIGHFIWSERLEACRNDLLDPAMAGRSIGDIAYGWGFSDAAHFSRTFRDRYAMSPREMRAGARRG